MGRPWILGKQEPGSWPRGLGVREGFLEEAPSEGPGGVQDGGLLGSRETASQHLLGGGHDALWPAQKGRELRGEWRR